MVGDIWYLNNDLVLLMVITLLCCVPFTFGLNPFGAGLEPVNPVSLYLDKVNLVLPAIWALILLT
jgi:hypothetical protein